jgi:hypothetical protein
VKVSRGLLRFSGASLLIVAMFAVPQIAFAGTIPGVNTSSFQTMAVGIFQVILGLFGLGAMVFAAIEYFQHHKPVNAAMEGIVGLLLLVVAFNGQAIAQNVGLSGALLR